MVKIESKNDINSPDKSVRSLILINMLNGINNGISSDGPVFNLSEKKHKFIWQKS